MVRGIKDTTHVSHFVGNGQFSRFIVHIFCILNVELNRIVSNCIESNFIESMSFLYAGVEKAFDHIDDSRLLLKEVFTSYGDFVVIMKFLDVTKCNENRPGIVNPSHARYWADQLEVIRIEHVQSKHEIKRLTDNILGGFRVLFETGKIVCYTWVKELKKFIKGVYYYHTRAQTIKLNLEHMIELKYSGPFQQHDTETGAVSFTGYLQFGIRVGQWNFYEAPMSRTDRTPFATRVITYESGNYRRIETFNPVTHLRASVEEPNSLGEIRYITYHPNGNNKSEYTKFKGKNIRSFYEWYPNKVLKKEMFYDPDGELSGAYKTYHSNGRTEIEGKYLKGKKIEKWNYYNPSGILTDIEIYSNGKLIEHNPAPVKMYNAPPRKIVPSCVSRTVPGPQKIFEYDELKPFIRVPPPKKKIVRPKKRPPLSFDDEHSPTEDIPAPAEDVPAPTPASVGTDVPVPPPTIEEQFPGIKFVPITFLTNKTIVPEKLPPPTDSTSKKKIKYNIIEPSEPDNIEI